MIKFKTKQDIEQMREPGWITAMVFAHLKPYVQPGITTRELDRIAEKFIRKHGATPSFKGYMGYRHTLCTSVNNHVVHGIPGHLRLKEGDIISVDVGALKNGFHGDATRTFPVGKISEAARKLVRVTYKSMMLGIEQCQRGNRLGDVGHVIQNYAETNGFSVVREYIGHGVGRQLHEDPEVLHFGKPGRGITLEPGMVITIEPILNEGKRNCRTLKDGWSVVTEDGKWSAQFENTVAITENGPEVLTVAEDGSDIPDLVKDIF
ncbi:MAG: type I methionyl aminopeptidase [Acidobacteria bacterium CG_4_9_14_3_um_filter_49_7]|nr:MAG: type I methionyl aminopeptidase [Acidobacteria bacterium CG_4_9_14_3_um_filter_49_7]